jgi:hypothetical protein
MSNRNGKPDFDGLQVLEAAGTAEQVGQRQPWERQPGESSKSHAAFMKYLNLAERRTLARVAEMLGCSAQNVERWSRRWCWVSRVQAFDEVEEQKFREQVSRDRLKMRRRQIEIGRACQNLAAYGIRELQVKVAAGTALDMSPEEIKALLSIGADLESRGMGEERLGRYTQINVVIGDAVPIPDERETREARLLLEAEAEATDKPN